MAYKSGGAWFICDRCSQKRRRAVMRKEWDGLIVCPPCEDPRPPEMTPPDIYPEGMPLPDPRPPQETSTVAVWFVNARGVPAVFMANDGTPGWFLSTVPGEEP